MHNFTNLSGFKWILVTLTVMIGSSPASVIEKRQLLLSVQSVKPGRWMKQFVTARARPGLCNGKRLDSVELFDPDYWITVRECTELGGTCCNLSPAWGYASNDPVYMKPSDGCHGCYDTNVTVQCSGLLLRRRDGSNSNLIHQVTAENCIQSGGRCCDSSLIPELILFGGASIGVFDPLQHPQEESCSNCYSGPLAGLGCSGKLLQSDSYTANICTEFGGQCCQGIYGAFNPDHYPGRDCSSCYSGSLE